MPYIVKVSTPHVWQDMPQHPDDDGVRMADTVECVAVASLEDARKVAGLAVGQSGGKASDWVRYYDEAAAIKVGESMGPLPDGTIIEIERVPVHGLARRAKHDSLLARALAAGDSPADSLTHECVAAFNAKQAA